MFCGIVQHLYGPGFPTGCNLSTWTAQDPFLKFTTLNLDKERDPGYGPGMLFGSTQVAKIAACFNGTQGGSPILTGSKATVTRFTMTYMTPDEQARELVDKATLGKFREDNRTSFDCFAPSTDPNVTFSRGTEFVSTDGSAMTFVSDSEFTYPDFATINTINVESLTLPTGYLHFRDGSTSRIQGGLIHWSRDRNGNKTTFDYVNNKLSTIMVMEKTSLYPMTTPLTRQAKEKRLYLDSNSPTSLVNQETYDRTFGSGETVVTVDVKDASSNLLSRRKSYFHGYAFAVSSVGGTPLWGLEQFNWKHGREYKTEYLATDGTTILRRKND